MRGLIAASVYGGLEPQEQRQLEGHLVSCPACRIEAESLARLAASIPTGTPALDRDLLPAVRAAVRETRPGRSWNLSWRWAGMAAACAVFFVAFGVVVQSMPSHQAAPAAITASVASLTPVQQALAETKRLIENRDFPKAYVTLKKAVEAHPEDAAAADAQVQRAGLAYSELHWYPEAYEDYELLAQRYPAEFSSSPESIARRDLLAEAREQDFASLHALDAARRNTSDAFAQLEHVVSHYPGTFVASAAAEDMARVAGEENTPGDGSNPHLAAMECARERCVDPVVRKQLEFEIARIYHREMNDFERARQHYQDVASGGDTLLAQAARQSLASLDLELAH